MKKLELRNRKDEKIVGVLEKPAGKILGTFVIQHGWGGHRDKPTMQAIKDGCLAAGFQTFNFDTTNSFGESDGDFEKSTLGSFVEDFEDVANWAQYQEWFTGPLAVAGHSKGGYSAIKYAENYPGETSFVLAVAPVVSGKLSFEAHQENNPEELKKWETEKIVERIGKEGVVKRLHWHQMEERLKHNLLPDVEKITMPILLIVGSEDTSCPPKHIKILFDSIPSKEKQMNIMKGGPHSFYEASEQKECRDIIKDWLTTHANSSIRIQSK